MNDPLEVVIAGGSGLIGQEITSLLMRTGNYAITVLTRSPDKHKGTEKLKFAQWDGKSIISTLLDGKYAVINLIGENIGLKSWSDKQKKEILNSRVLSARTISESVCKCTIPPKVYIQASAVGYYPNNSTGKENDNYTNQDFLSEVCFETEKQANKANGKTRMVIIRTGVVFASRSALWKQITSSFSFGIAAILGNGKQYMPWIHIEDEVGAIKFLLESPNCNGAYNLCSPNAASWNTIIPIIQSHRQFSIRIHIPALILKIIFGKQKASELLLKNQPVYPYKLIDSGYIFKYPNLEETISDLEKQ